MGLKSIIERFLFPSIIMGALVGCGTPNNSSSSQAANSSSSSQNSPNACLTDSLPPTLLRRLTRFEYRNTVADLLGVDTSSVSEIPADEADGFDNNAALQVAADFLVEKYVVVSEKLAALAVQDVAALTDCNAAISGERACAEKFAREFGRKAFRRRLEAEDHTLLMTAYDVGQRGGSHQEGIEVMIRYALQSPEFLYRLELSEGRADHANLVPLNSFEMATRLAFFIWGTGPDDNLLDVAEANLLQTREQVAEQARQMLQSPKAQVSLTNFLEQWSGVRRLETVSKNTTLFPNYSDRLRDAMQRELPAMVADMLQSNQATVRNLLTSTDAYVSGPLAGIYGISQFGESDTVRKMSHPANQPRSGLLTQAGFLSVQAHPDQTSPVLRGQFVRANLLCNPPPPPPDDLDISVPEVTVGSTARDRAELHLSAGNSCSGCHNLMDPIGLAFENFDALGQFQEFEGGQRIDVSGELLFVTEDALEGAFSGVAELGQKLSASTVVQNCIANHMFRFSAGRFEEPGDQCSLTTIQDRFTAHDGDIVELMVAMTQTDAFLYKAEGDSQ